MAADNCGLETIELSENPEKVTEDALLEIEGEVLKESTEPELYWVLNGQTRLIPNEATYLNFFTNWDTI